MKPWFVYMIRCTNGHLYTGCTTDVIRRWHQHKQGKGAKYLRAHEPKAVVFTEQQPNRSKACKREYEIKGYAKRKKEDLIP